MNELLAGSSLPSSLGSFDFSSIIRSTIIFTIIGFAAWIGIWLLVRQAKLWYWKVDKMMVLLESIEANTRIIAKSIQDKEVKKESKETVGDEADNE
jgi:hypothetical protein